MSSNVFFWSLDSSGLAWQNHCTPGSVLSWPDWKSDKISCTKKASAAAAAAAAAIERGAAADADDSHLYDAKQDGQKWRQWSQMIRPIWAANAALALRVHTG